MFGTNTSKPDVNKSPNPQTRDPSNILGTTSNATNFPSNITSSHTNTGHKPKPSLKLNMNKNHVPPSRSLASISNTIPNFTNSGPFSPGLFTSKRVWVKRSNGNGTATTIVVNQNDIIDDLKSAIMTKFPNALAKYFDPADLIVKMDLQSRKQPSAVTSNNNNISGQQQPHKKVNIWTQSVSPESSKSTTSPITSTFKDQVPLQPSLTQSSTSIPNQFHDSAPQNSNQNAMSQSYSYINLEPDQNVWNLLDLYFPGGMSMSEAFIIDTPMFEDHFESHQNHPLHHQTPHNSYHSNHQIIDDPHHEVGNINTNLKNYYGSNSNLSNLYTRSISPVQTNPGYNNFNRSVTPNSANSNPNYYHQPNPQYLNSTNSLYKDRSVSPGNGNMNPINKSSPLPSGINLHRRSQSNPPQSPISNALKSSNTNGSNNNNPNTSSINNSANPNQAVLLLPKNFSLSANANGDKKRLSLDENFVSKNRDRLIQSPMGKNINNLNNNSEGSESPVPFPSLLETKQEHHSLPKLNISDGANDINGNKIEPTLDSPSTPVDTRIKDDQGIPITQYSDEKRDQENNGGKNNNSNNGNNNHNNNINNTSNNPSNGKSKEKDQQIKRQSSGSKRNDMKNKSATEAVLPSISVLVVEDNAINQAILGAFLRKHKIQYEIAKNGEEAIAKWRKGGFHLVLMDIQLPVKSGIEATKEIRYLERINRIGVFAENELHGPKSLTELSDNEKLDIEVFRSPVIIVALTASSNSSVDRSNALRAGCNDYLTKPVNLVWLQNKITEWGCMQALIDFDGWKLRSNFNGNSAKIIAAAQTTRNRSRSGSATQGKGNKVVLGGASQRHQKKLQT